MSGGIDRARCFEGSYVGDRWEFRVTARCLTDDLGVPADTPFTDLLAYEIVKALLKDRAEQPYGTKTISQLTCGKQVYRLGYGHDHRGATWHDDTRDVVWLLAYHGRHRSGAADDAWPYFRDLDGAGCLVPTQKDQDVLERERGRRFVERAYRVVPELVAAAREHPEQEQRASIGDDAVVGIAFEIVETFEERYLRVSPVGLRPGWLKVLLALVFGAGGAWEPTDRFPGREPATDELRFRSRELTEHLP